MGGRYDDLQFAAVREANPAAFEDTCIDHFLPLKECSERPDGGVSPPVDVAAYSLKSVAA